MTTGSRRWPGLALLALLALAGPAPAQQINWSVTINDPTGLYTSYYSTSVMLHELGHARGFNGWRDLSNGSLPGNYMSTFDRYVSFNGSEFYFNGPAAVAAHGGPVPLTYGNIFHVGNAAGSGPGQD